MGKNDALRLDWGAMGLGSGYCVCVAQVEILKVNARTKMDLIIYRVRHPNHLQHHPLSTRRDKIKTSKDPSPPIFFSSITFSSNERLKKGLNFN